MRPSVLKKDNTLHWVIRTYTDAGVLLDADSNPTVAVRKNGASTADIVTVTKRTSTTGIYDCSYTPTSVEGDCFTFEETALISLVPYEQSFSVNVLAAERGTDSALLAADKPTNFDLLAINGSGEVTTSNPAAGGGSAHTAQDVADLILATPANLLATNASGEVVASNMRGTDNANTVAPNNAAIADILVDTNELQTNQGDWATATGFSTHSAADVANVILLTPANKLNTDVSGNVEANNMRGTDSALLAASAPSNWSTLIVGTGADAGKVTTSNPASGGGSNHTAQDVANLILATPANLLATDASGNVEANNMRGTDNASTHSAADVVTSMQSVADDFKADVSSLATQTSVDSLDTDIQAVASGVAAILTDTATLVTIEGKIDAIDINIDAILVDTNELQGNQGDWATATGFNTIAPDNVSISAILNDTNELQANQGDWATATGFNTVAPDNASISAILADTSDLQANQGDWLTATTTIASNAPANWGIMLIDGSGKVTTSNPAAGGGSQHTAQDVANLILTTPANKLTTDANGDVAANNMRGTDGANTVTPVDVSGAIAALNDFDPTSDVVARVTLVDTTTDLTNQASGGTNPADIYTYFTAGSREDAFKADVSGLSTFDPNSDQVVASNMRGTDNALLATSAPSNWSTLIVGTGADAGKVTTSNPAAGAGSSHTAQDVANLILVTPANKLATDNNGDVAANNMRGTDGANTVTPDNASISAILADTSDLQANQGDWLTATGFNTVAPDNASISAILNDTNELQANQGDWATATGFNTIAPDNASISAILADTSDLQANQGDWLTATTVVASNMRGTDNALLASDAPTNFDLMTINGSGAVTTSNPSTGGTGSDHTAEDVAALILAVPGTPINNTSSGSIALVDTTTNLTNQSSGGTNPADIYTYFTDGNREDAFKATGFNTIAPDNASISAILADTSDLQANQGDWVTATGFATPADVSTSQVAVTDAIDLLNDFDPNNDVVARVTLVDTTTLVTNDVSGGTNPADVYNYFVSGSREDAFKADVSDLALQATLTSFKGATELTLQTLVQDVDNLNDFDPDTDLVTTDLASRNASKADITSLATLANQTALATQLGELNDFNPATQVVTTDAASRNASKADVTALATSAQINALDVKITANGIAIDNSLKKNINYRWTNYGSGTGFDMVTITEA